MQHPAVEQHPRFLKRFDFEPTSEAMRSYNPAVCLFGKGLVMAWRVQNDRGLSHILISALGSDHRRTGKTRTVQIEAPDKTHVEDPRLCVIAGELLLFVVTVLHGFGFTFKQRCFALGADFQPVREISLPYGKNGNGTHEKNWMPFELPSGKLGLVYKIGHEHVVIDTWTGTTHRTTGVKKWRWGTMSGRSNAVLLPDGKRYLALIGGHQPHAKRNSEYWFGAYTFSAEAPHEILSVSRDPIVWASDRTPALVNPFDSNWNPICIFPAGLVLENDLALVSVGLNDSYCALMQFPVSELLSNHVHPEELTGLEKRLAPPSTSQLGNVRVRYVKTLSTDPNSKQLLGEPGGPYKVGDEFFTSEDRAVALGRMVEVIR